MSLPHQEEVTCPNCGRKGNLTIWDSINTELDPNMKAKVRSGEAFMYTCPRCHQKTIANYAFLYHQMEDHIMIYYVTNKAELKMAYEALEASPIAGIPKEAMFEMARRGYTKRIVVSHSEFCEKLGMIDQHYDDRILEIMKVLCKADYAQQFSNQQIGQVIFYPKDRDNFYFIFTAPNGQELQVPVTRQYYDNIAKKLLPKLNANTHDQLFIGEEWAIDFIETR